MGKLINNRPFRFLFSGRIVTNIGDSLYIIAAMWLIYDLTGSTLYTGIGGFLVQAPVACQFLTGPLVDRWRIRPVLIVIQVLNGILVLAVPLAVAVGVFSVWVVLLVLPLVSLLNQFVYPAQNAALPQIVSDENLVRANSLFSIAYQSLDAVFTASSGVILAFTGAVSLFVLDSFTFFVAAGLFYLFHIPDEPGGDETSDETSDQSSTRTEAEESDEKDESIWQSYRDELLEGFAYIRGSTLMSIFLGLMVANFTGGALMAVLPKFADAIGGPQYYGLLMSATAAGMVAGSVSASFVERIPYGTISTATLSIHGILLALSVVVPSTTLTISLYLVAYVPIGVFNVSTWAMIQSAVKDDFLARVTSTVSSLSQAVAPLGSLIGGAVAEAFGSGTVIYITGMTLVLVGLYFLFRARVRRLPAVEDINEDILGLGGGSNVS